MAEHINNPEQKTHKWPFETNCQNCGHMTCMFFGEDRNPVYGDVCWFPICWIEIVKS